MLLHGLASDENDLLGLAIELDPRFTVVTLRAPYETGYGGYAWFNIQFLPDGRRIMDERQAAASLEVLLAELASLKLAYPGKSLLLGGFSQGAMMSAGVVAKAPESIVGAWLMSGRWLPVFGREKTNHRLPVLVQHGQLDELLRIEEGKELAQVLSSMGHQVQFEEYPMGHQVSAHSIEDAVEWMKGLGL